MKVKREMLEDQLEEYEEQRRGLNSFITELKTTTAKHNTDAQQFQDDLMEAQHNLKYFDGEIARVKSELSECAKETPDPKGKDSILPTTAKQGIGSLIFSSISFGIGALLGSKLKSRSSKKDDPPRDN